MLLWYTAVSSAYGEIWQKTGFCLCGRVMLNPTQPDTQVCVVTWGLQLLTQHCRLGLSDRLERPSSAHRNITPNLMLQPQLICWNQSDLIWDWDRVVPVWLFTHKHNNNVLMMITALRSSVFGSDGFVLATPPDPDEDGLLLRERWLITGNDLKMQGFMGRARQKACTNSC